MKTLLFILFTCLTSSAIGQKEFRIETTYNGFDVYDGYRKVESVEKNYSNGYDVFEYNKWGTREKVQSVEKGYGDEYVVYTYAEGYKEKSHTIRGYDQYLRQLYGGTDRVNNSVQVYDVPSGGYIDNLGKTVLPADIKPFDFSEVDNLLAAQKRVNAELEKLWIRAQEIAAILTEGGISEAEKTKLINELKAIKVRVDNLPQY